MRIPPRRQWLLRIGDTPYAVLRLDADPSIASRAYRVQKASGEGPVYDVRIDRYGPQCECLGFLRWNRPCKHIRGLQEEGIIDRN